VLITVHASQKAIRVQFDVSDVAVHPRYASLIVHLSNLIDRCLQEGRIEPVAETALDQIKGHRLRSKLCGSQTSPRLAWG